MNRSVRAKVSVMVCAVVLATVLRPMVAVGQTAAAGSTKANDEARRFRAFLAEDWKRWMQEYPEFATSVGFPGQNRRWTDDSPAGREARIKHLGESTAPMKQFHRELLPPNAQLNYHLY